PDFSRNVTTAYSPMRTLSPGSRSMVSMLRLYISACAGLRVRMQLVAQRVAHQRPDPSHRVLSGDLTASLRVEVLRAYTDRLAGHGGAVAQDEDTEGQTLHRRIDHIELFQGSRLVYRSELYSVSLTTFHLCCRGICCREIVLADNGILDILHRDARASEAFVLDFLLDVAHANASLAGSKVGVRSEEHTSELQSRENLVCRLLLEKKKQKARKYI